MIFHGPTVRVGRGPRQAVNLLAHALLADGSPESILGNLAADFLKPADLDQLPERVRQGVLLHRHVDAFTDRHPVVQRSITRISRDWHWFSGILIDVYYDHILATEWAAYSDVPLRAFVDRVHDVIRGHAGHLPEYARGVVMAFMLSDRLMTYSVPDGSGIEDALRALSARIAARMPKRAVRLDAAVPQLRAAHADLAADFREFFPKLRAFAAGWAPPTRAT